jgi:hypothetical protein
VKVSAAVATILLLLFLTVHLAGGGLGRHLHPEAVRRAP